MARSTATQAITLEWVKWRRGPRTSQMPSSGSFQPDSMNPSARAEVPGRPRRLASGPARLVQGSEHLAVDVELVLLRGGVADAYRSRALVAWQPGELTFFEVALAGRRRT